MRCSFVILVNGEYGGAAIIHKISHDHWPDKHRLKRPTDRRCPHAAAASMLPVSISQTTGCVYSLVDYAILFVNIVRRRDHVAFSVYLYGLMQWTLGVRNRRRSVQMTAIKRVTIVYFSVLCSVHTETNERPLELQYIGCEYIHVPHNDVSSQVKHNHVHDSDFLEHDSVTFRIHQLSSAQNCVRLRHRRLFDDYSTKQKIPDDCGDALNFHVQSCVT